MNLHADGRQSHEFSSVGYSDMVSNRIHRSFLSVRKSSSFRLLSPDAIRMYPQKLNLKLYYSIMMVTDFGVLLRNIRQKNYASIILEPETGDRFSPRVLRFKLSLPFVRYCCCCYSDRELFLNNFKECCRIHSV